MKKIDYQENCYHTAQGKNSPFFSLFPTFSFYTRFLWEVVVAAICAKRGKYNGTAWVKSSWAMFKALESVGVKFEVDGIQNIEGVDGPVVFIGNHMSTLETTILPILAHERKPLCFVIKQSLLEYPVFKYVAGARHPIAVSRTNPRADLKTVMEEGCKRLESGRSVVVFPQTTRSLTFAAEDMSSIGVKLAAKAGVPVIPIALKTDAWENGEKLKDFGQINPKQKVFFSFGKPLSISGKGGEEQKEICHFIEQKLNQWQ